MGEANARGKLPRAVRALRLVEGVGTCLVPAELIRVSASGRPVVLFDGDMLGAETWTYWEYISEVPTEEEKD